MASRPPPRTSFVRRRPFLAFGLPFMTLIAGSSFFLERFTRTRYELRDSQKSYMSTAELERLEDNQVDPTTADVRELYFKLTANNRNFGYDPVRDEPRPAPKPLPEHAKRRPAAATRKTADSTTAGSDFFKPSDDWDNVRVARPAGTAEWGERPKTREEMEEERMRKWV